jgi:multidrug efflux pump subunit AcrA (membrane-fusion protein)
MPQNTDGGGGGGGLAQLRTAVVKTGTLEYSLRLTGVTAADKFQSVVVPQMRGGRGGGGVTIMSSVGGMGRGGATIQISMSGGGGMGGGRSGGGGGGSRDSGGGGGGSQGGDSSGSATSSSGGSSGGGISTGGGASSAGFRGSSANRFGSSSVSTGSRTTSSSSASSSRGAAGAAASSGGSFGGGDFQGMSGGASDFMQVLEKVAPSGSMVRKGAVVAEFDRQYQQTRLDDYRSTVDQQERSLKRVDADLEVSRKQRELTLAQAQAYVDKAKLDIRTVPVRSQIESEQLRLNLEEAEAQLKMVKAQMPFAESSDKASLRNSELEIQTARRELKRAEDNVEKMLIKAPMDGMVVMQNGMRGSEFSQIRQGDQLFPGQMFMQIVDPSSMVVNATVNQADVELLRIGAKAKLSFDAYPGLEAPAHVVGIGAITKTAGMREKFMREIPVTLKIDRMDPRIIPDLSVSVDVVVESKEGVVLAPRESIFLANGESGEAFVYVRNAKGGFDRRTVQVTLRNNTTVGIGDGVRPGDVLAVEEPPAGKDKKQAQSGA